MLLILCRPGLAQQEASNWYFGFGAGVNFSGGLPAKLTDGEMSVEEGSAAFSDAATGELLFYTDGMRVWDRAHFQMPNSRLVLPAAAWPQENGFTISTSQPALIVPHPGNPQQYYVFNPGNRTSTQGRNEILPATAQQLFFSLCYSLVDMSQRSGFGDVIERRAVQPAVRLAEKITGISDCLQQGYWIISHNLPGNAFYAYHVGPDGLNVQPVISRVGPSLPSRMEGVGYMKVSPDGKMLANLNWEYLRLEVELYDFNTANGTVSNFRSITLSQNAGRPSFYGVSFSPDNSKLYVSSENLGGSQRLYQFSVTEATQSAILASAVNLASSSTLRIGALQLAPDGKLYVAGVGETALSVINFPNRSGLACDFQENVVDFAFDRGDFEQISVFGLPNYMDHIFNQSPLPPPCGKPRSDFAVDDVCVGSCVEIREGSSAEPLEWRWEFEGALPASSDEREPPPICFETAGAYRIRLITRNLAGADTLDRIIRVLEGDEVDAGPDQRICRGETVRLSATGSGSFRWASSATLSALDIADPVASPSSSSTYYLVHESESGCISRDSVRVIVNEVHATISSAATICAGEEVGLLAGGGLRYSWQPSAGLSDPSLPDPLATPLSTTRYEVTVWDENDCSSTASVTISVNPLPAFTPQPDVELCRGETVTLRAAGGTRYEWTPVEGLNDASSPNPLAAPQVSTEYVVEVFSDAGCSRADTIVVTVRDQPQLSLEQDRIDICAGGETTLRVAGAERYRWTPAEGLSDPLSAEPTVQALTTTVYTVSGWIGDCVSTASVRVNVLPLPELELSADTTICRGARVQLQAAGADRYQWEPAAGLSDPTIPDPIAAPDESTLYQLRAATNDGCEARAELWVRIREFSDVIIGIPDTLTTPGERFRLPLRIEVPEALLPLELRRLRFELRYQARLLRIRGVDQGTTMQRRVEGGDVILTLDVPSRLLQQSETKLFEFETVGLITMLETTTLRIENIEAEFQEDVCINVAGTSGSYGIHEYCLGYEVGLRQLLALRVAPNPADAEVDISIRPASGSDRQLLELFDNFGRRLWRTEVRSQDGQSYSLKLETASLSAGIYLLRLRSADQVETARILVRR